MFTEVVNRAMENLDDGDLMNVIIRDQVLNHPIVVPLQPEINANVIMEKVEAVLQSEESITIDSSFEVIVGAIRLPAGRGRTRITQVEGQGNSFWRKRSMVYIENEDNLCLARSIGVAFAKHCIVSAHEWKACENKKTVFRRKDAVVIKKNF